MENKGTFFLISGSLKIFKRKEKNILRQMKKSTTVLNFQDRRKNNSKRGKFIVKVYARTKKNLSSLTSNNTEITKDNKDYFKTYTNKLNNLEKSINSYQYTILQDKLGRNRNF